MNNNELWAQILSRIESSVSTMIYNIYFRDTTLLNIDNNNTLKIQVKNEFIKNHLINHFDDLISDSIRDVTHKDYLYELVTDMVLQEVEIPKKKEETTEFISQLPLEDTNIVNNNEVINVVDEVFPDYNDNLDPKHTFENFIVGNQNAVAFTAAQGVAKNPGKLYNPLFIYGKSGLGKTHLMEAIGNEIKNTLNKRVLYVSSKQFKEDYQEIFSHRGTNTTLLEAFKKKYYDIDVLIIDDIQFLSNAEKTQEEFHNTFESLHRLEKQIIISSDSSPNDLQNFADRLKTRFGLGLSVQINPPDFDLKLKILQNKIAGQETAEIIKPEVLEYIANNSPSDIRHLQGLINKLYLLISLYRPEVVDLNFILTNGFDEDINNNIYSENSVDKIKKAVADYYNLTVDTLKSKKRKAEINKARQIAIYLCAIKTDETVERIGLSFNRDHATVIHAREKITEDIKNSEQIKREINEIIDKI